MSTNRKFLMYVSWVILFFIFSQIMIFVALNTTYAYKKIEVANSIIKEAQVEATSINGKAKFKLFNNTSSDLENKYIQLDCYSKNGTLMGTKYIGIDKIPTNEEKELEVRFNYNRVDNAKVKIVNEIPKNINEEQKKSDPEMNMAMLVTALILLLVFG